MTALRVNRLTASNVNNKWIIIYHVIWYHSLGTTTIRTLQKLKTKRKSSCRIALYGFFYGAKSFKLHRTIVHNFSNVSGNDIRCCSVFCSFSRARRYDCTHIPTQCKNINLINSKKEATVKRSNRSIQSKHSHKRKMVVRNRIYLHESYGLSCALVRRKDKFQKFHVRHSHVVVYWM